MGTAGEAAGLGALGVFFLPGWTRLMAAWAGVSPLHLGRDASRSRTGNRGIRPQGSPDIVTAAFPSRGEKKKRKEKNLCLSEDRTPHVANTTPRKAAIRTWAGSF